MQELKQKLADLKADLDQTQQDLLEFKKVLVRIGESADSFLTIGLNKAQDDLRFINDNVHKLEERTDLGESEKEQIVDSLILCVKTNKTAFHAALGLVQTEPKVK